MKIRKFTHVFYLCFTFCFCICTVITLVIPKINLFLFLGYSAGALVAFFIFSINEMFAQINLIKSKKSAVIISFFRTMIILVIFSVFFIAIVLVDKYALINKEIINSVKVMYKPINIFGFLGGIFSLQITLLISYLIYIKMHRKEELNGRIAT